MDEKEHINRPFADLSKFLEEHRIKLKKEEARKEEKREARSMDDEALLREAMEGVRVIEAGGKRVPGKRVGRPCVNRRGDEAQKLLEEALSDHSVINVTNLPEYMEGYVEGINPLIMEKLRKGEFSVQKTLDLHGLSIEDAKESFDHFLSDAVKNGLKCVKVIHGRGLRSKRDPTIKDYLKTWIVRAMHRRWVTAFSNATMSDGGPGAAYILLRARPQKKRLRIIG